MLSNGLTIIAEQFVRRLASGLQEGTGQVQMGTLASCMMLTSPRYKTGNLRTWTELWTFSLLRSLLRTWYRWMQEASHVQGGNAKNGLKGIQSEYPIWTTIPSLFDGTRSLVWLWSESRWEFSTVTTPESVASRFSLVCSNDYQRSLSKVNCFVADQFMFKSY